jgi:hypothetical protein
MKTITFDTPDKMHFESAHQTFNKQTNLITEGNVISNTQYSSLIRAFTQTKCGDWEWMAGHLQNFDLDCFRHFNIPRVLDEVRVLTEDTDAYLYVFFHASRAGTRVLDGVVLTTREHAHIKTWYINEDWRAQDAVDMAREYIVA